MKIRMWFREELLGTGEASGEEPVRWSGDVEQLKSIARTYQAQGYQGEALLRRLLERVRGNTWTEEIL